MVELQRPASSVTAADEVWRKLSVQLRLLEIPGHGNRKWPRVWRRYLSRRISSRCELRIVRFQRDKYPRWPDRLRVAVWPRTAVSITGASQPDRGRLARLDHLPMA